MQKLMSITDAAKALGIGRTSAYKLMSEGQLETVSILKRRMVRVDSVRKIAGDPPPGDAEGR